MRTIPPTENNWAAAKLQDVCDLISDGTHHSPPNFDSGDFPYITAKNIKKHGLDTSINLTYVSKEIHQEIYSRCPVEFEDVLYIKDGATTGIAAINNIREPFSMLSSVALLKPIKTVLNPYFLKHWLNSPNTYNNFTGKMSGSAIKRVVLKQIREALIDLPPINEQTRIAQKLDELLAQVDTLKARIDSIPALLKRFRQSVLTAATSGQLTKARRTNSDTEENLSIDIEWREVSIEQASATEKYSLVIGPFGSNLKTADYRKSGRPLVFVREIRAEVFGDNKTKFITEEKFKELQAHKIQAGDILVTKMGDPPGDVAIYPADAPEAVITADCIKLRVNESLIIKKFAYFQIKSNKFRQQIIEISAGVAQQKVSLGNFRELLLLIPTIEEQTEIVRRVEQLFAFADQLEAKVQNAKERIDKLTQSILAKAFRGELVPQDPNDEPASVLLERIKAQRAAEPKAKRGRKKAESA